MQTRSYFFNLILQGERKMYSSYLTRETFENEHDEKMTRKFSYNYQVLKRLFPEVYKLPESEIRSLVHSIYDNPKLGDELLDHLTDVINKRKPEWGEYLNPKPEEPVQSVQQDNPLQPAQPKPLNTSSGFEPYKPQKSAFGLNNSGGFGQSKLPDLTKGLDFKRSDMVTGFGINEAKQNSMFGTGFQMPKLPKLPQFPKAPEPEQPQMPQFAPAPAPQFQQTVLNPQSQQAALAPEFPQTETAYSTYTTRTPMAWAQQTPFSNIQKANNYDVFDNAIRYITPGTYEIGRIIADSQIAYEHLQEMYKTNERLKKLYGRGAAAGTDDYYHPLLQCHLAQMSDQDRVNGLILGYLKEYPCDYLRKLSTHTHQERIADSTKDLNNNEYGSIIGDTNKTIPCTILLDHLRTENMRNANIR